MRLLVVLTALAMPLVAWLSNTGAFGPDNGTVSDRYPTLLVAAGYAFSIWGLIFLLDLAYAGWQATGARRRDPTLARVAPWAAAGFVLTTVWMPLFSNEWFVACLLVIFGAMACLVRCALLLSRDAAPATGQRLWAWLPLSLHAGWLTLAAFLNLAQVIVAYGWLPADDQLPWSLALFAVAAIVLLALNHRMRGNLAYVAAALWALAAVYVKQSGHDLPGADTAAWLAVAIAVALAVQTVFLLRTARRPSMPTRAGSTIDSR
ncbi:hypothetical protein QFW80_13600 [Luteimonas sp. M1R5S18]|uniref:Tryptophan-rich sensory protein n=1 Tax=Luteimonas rhizosphaericola TaxID=3042024 RepID=A0ABT6JLX2_9GAMM|nr:hypothetical protein [Luteimonas rhizosphaericola]MDH5831552.1 hypothetical protein [Luteimonas rhizosphaericola]